MNLKKSKFFKRIQMLRRYSKEKLRKENAQSLIEWQLKNAFWENTGPTSADTKIEENNNLSDACNVDSFNKINIKNSLKLQQKKFQNPQNKILSMPGTTYEKANGLIQLNNTCYPVECCCSVSKNKMRKTSSESIPSISASRNSICVSSTRYNLIARCAKTLGFRVVRETKMWNVLWTDSLPGLEIYKSMKRFQQINHFPGMMDICRKDLLSRNLNRMLKLYPNDYKIFPKTWVFPADLGEALHYANNHSKQKMFIIKPDSGAQGRGIWLTSDIKNISFTERMICQTYIHRPLLIDGYKFDLRVYTLITSVDPLRVFVYNEGLARLATNKYVEPCTDNCSDLYMHLTNYSVNRRNSQYELCEDDDCGSKRNFSAINNWMRLQNYDVKEFWNKIDDIIIKTILSAWPILKHNYHACFPGHDKIQACFEILGFDILVDSKLKPYVLEVNHSPSFHTHELVDRQVKRPLIRDTLALIGTVLADKKQILREDRKRIKQRLLRFKPGNLHNPTSKISPPMENISENITIECPVSAVAQQIAWEESHLGNYRRIMPTNDPVKLNYYCQFYTQQNQASIFADTAASKKREEVSKKLRKELEEKRLKQTEMLRRNTISFEERQRKRSSIPRITVEKQRQESMRIKADWSPGFISAAEERLRTSNMENRAYILKDLKVTETIYEILFNSGNLSKSDVVKFPHFQRCLEGGIKI